MLVTCSEMSAAENRFFSDGRSPEPWMDEAGKLCAAAILDFFPEAARAEIFCGSGNNGGDALVVARWLRRYGWSVSLNLAGSLSELARKKLAEFEAEPSLTDPVDRGSRPLVVVDGLLGIGAKGDLRGGILAMADHINALRRDKFATCFAIDLPSGFDADKGIAGPGAVVADYTLSITAPKIGFASDGAADHVGRLVEIPLDIPVSGGDDSRGLLFPSNLRPRLERRPFETHKGGAGRVVIAAGSRGLTGAAVLTAFGASRGGAGLVTVCVPEVVYEMVAGKAPPEVMVRPYRDFEEVAAIPADAFAVGPGLGAEPLPGLLEFLIAQKKPVVIDADALNLVARAPVSLARLPENRLLTPHPGEMARLVERAEGSDRGTLARHFADARGVTLLYKGARTVIASPGRPLEFNTTGHPGMASGGMGDVLTGLCAALIAGRLGIHDAACVGSWLLGRAAEIAVVREGTAEESVSATLVAEHLGAALRALQTPGSP